MYYTNPNLVKLNRIFDQNLREGYLRLDLNENPGGLPEAFIKSVLEEVTPEFLSQYPETMPFTKTLAKFLGVQENEICLTNGSAEGIRYIIEAYTRPGGKILGVSPSYAMYEVYSKMYGREFIPVKYSSEFKMNADDIIAQLTPDIDLLVILNPNNPVGDVYSYDEMDRLIAAAKKNEATVLIDEAYFYFYPNSFIKYALENDHVFLTRTFSKLFSLGSSRLGYVIGRPKGVSIVQKLCTPHNVNAFGLKFAQKIIETDGMIDSLVNRQLEGKKYLVEELEKNGYTLSAKEGNFIFIKTKTDAKRVMDRLKQEKKILVKTYDGIGSFGTCLRVTTGEKELMDKFVRALVDVDR